VTVAELEVLFWKLRGKPHGNRKKILSHDDRYFDGDLNQTYLQRRHKRDPTFLVRWDFVDAIKKHHVELKSVIMN